LDQELGQRVIQALILLLYDFRRMNEVNISEVIVMLATAVLLLRLLF
jgi:hypothetical protein